MVQTQSNPAGQTQQDKEERGKLSVDLPISAVEATMASFGFGGEVEEPTAQPELLKEQEQLFADAHPDDVEELEQRMGGAPEGAQIPESARQMPSRYKNMSERASGAPGRPAQSVPAGQEGIPQFTGGEGGLPSQREAFEFSMRTPPPVQTKDEFMAGQKSPEWWRIMLADFAGGAPGAGRAEWEAKADEMYQRAIQGQMQERSELERKQGVVAQYAVKPEDEMVKIPLWEGGPEIDMQRKNLGQAMPLFTRRAEEHYKKGDQVSLREMFGGDTSVPDLKMDRDVAIEYGKFIIQRKAQGLDKERDWLFKHDRPTWDALQKLDLERAKELAKIKKSVQDEVTQAQPSENYNARELASMLQYDEFNNETFVSPQLSGYLDSITKGQGEVTKQEKYEYAENVRMMNHTRFKTADGDTSPHYDYYKAKLEDGWYFMGERIPDNEKKAKAKLRTMRDQNKADTVQTSAFMMTHFGKFNRDFEVQAPDPKFDFDPEAQGVEKLKPPVSRYIPPPEKKEEGPPALTGNQTAESAVQAYAQQRQIPWKDAVARFEAAGREIVMGR